MQNESASGAKKRRLSPLVCGILLSLILSFFLSCFAILLLDDRYSFFKQSGSVRITVSDSDTEKEIAEKCKEAGIIRFSAPLASYLKKSDTPIEGGIYTVPKDASYLTLASVFHRKRATTLTLTFTEGMTVLEIISSLTQAGIGSAERYREVINTYPFDFDWIPKDYPSTRPYRLEGYLYPDTYEFYQNASEESVIFKLLANFDRKFGADYRAECARRNMTVDQAVTMASVIQAEVKYLQEYPLVSSVLHNRLSAGRRWESDATVRYALSLQGIDRAVTPDDLRTPHPFNTYQNFGYPPGAICNPSIEAIAYAICPKKSDYYYFVSDANGSTLFANSYQKHLENIEKVKKLR